MRRARVAKYKIFSVRGSIKYAGGAQHEGWIWYVLYPPDGFIGVVTTWSAAIEWVLLREQKRL